MYKSLIWYTQTLKVKNISLYNKITDDPLAVLPMIITIVIIFIYCKVQGIIFLIFLTSGACASIWVKEREDSLKYTFLLWDNFLYLKKTFVDKISNILKKMNILNVMCLWIGRILNILIEQNNFLIFFFFLHKLSKNIE